MPRPGAGSTLSSSLGLTVQVTIPQPVPPQDPHSPACLGAALQAIPAVSSYGFGAHCSPEGGHPGQPARCVHPFKASYKSSCWQGVLVGCGIEQCPAPCRTRCDLEGQERRAGNSSPFLRAQPCLPFSCPSRTEGEWELWGWGYKELGGSRFRT